MLLASLKLDDDYEFPSVERYSCMLPMHILIQISTHSATLPCQDLSRTMMRVFHSSDDANQLYRTISHPHWHSSKTPAKNLFTQFFFQLAWEKNWFQNLKISPFFLKKFPDTENLFTIALEFPISWYVFFLKKITSNSEKVSSYLCIFDDNSLAYYFSDALYLPEILAHCSCGSLGFRHRLFGPGSGSALFWTGFPFSGSALLDSVDMAGKTTQSGNFIVHWNRYYCNCRCFQRWCNNWLFHPNCVATAHCVLPQLKKTWLHSGSTVTAHSASKPPPHPNYCSDANIFPTRILLLKLFILFTFGLFSSKLEVPKPLLS